MSQKAPYTYKNGISLRNADPYGDAQTLMMFGRDLYVESLGDAAAFWRDYGPGGRRFPRWVGALQTPDPRFAAMLMRDSEAIGLVAVGSGGRKPRAHRAGHVHHLFVRADCRGQGYGGLLDDYARSTLSAAGHGRAVLNTTARNARAIRFYEAQGWRRVAGEGGQPIGRLRPTALVHYEVDL